MLGSVCARCGAVGDFDADAQVWCGPACLELHRRGVPYQPEEAPPRLQGRERIEGVDALLDRRADDELDRIERGAGANLRDTLHGQERARYRGPETDAYGRIVDAEEWLGSA